MLTENKFSKYLLYAIGEIVLVVIGILIALNINNQNEKHQNKEKLDTIFIEVQRELAQTIDRTTKVIDFYERKDSLLYLILNNQLSEADYIKKPLLSYALANYRTIHIQNNGYLRLTENLDILPTSFNPVLSSLNLVYEYDSSRLYASQDKMKQFMTENVNYLSDKKSWFHEYAFKTTLNDESLAYFANDHFYKNKVFQYRMYYQDLPLQTIKLDAVRAYKALSELTGRNKTLDASVYYQTDEQLSKYAGTYEIDSKDVLFNKDKGYNLAFFKVEKGQLKARLYGDEDIEIFPHAKNVFILDGRDNGKFTFIENDNDKIIGLEFFNNSVYTNWTKVK